MQEQDGSLRSTTKHGLPGLEYVCKNLCLPGARRKTTMTPLDPFVPR